MTNAEPTSTDSTTERAENTESQPSLVAVSEENLAALLRATSATAEPEVQQEAAAPVTEVKEEPAVEESVVSEPVVVESRRALFAAVKERRSEILQAAGTPAPAPVEQQEYPAPSLPAEAAAIQVTLPKSQPVIAAAPTSMPAPSRTLSCPATDLRLSLCWPATARRTSSFSTLKRAISLTYWMTWPQI